MRSGHFFFSSLPFLLNPTWHVPPSRTHYIQEVVMAPMESPSTTMALTICGLILSPTYGSACLVVMTPPIIVNHGVPGYIFMRSAFPGIVFSNGPFIPFRLFKSCGSAISFLLVTLTCMRDLFLICMDESCKVAQTLNSGVI